MKRDENAELEKFLDFIIQRNNVWDSTQSATIDSAKQTVLAAVRPEEALNETALDEALWLILAPTPMQRYQGHEPPVPISLKDAVLLFLNKKLATHFKVRFRRTQKVEVYPEIYQKAKTALEDKPSTNYRVVYEYVADAMEEALESNSPVSEVLE